MGRIISVLGIVCGIVLVSSPSFAVMAVPEPSTLSIFGVGIACAFVARKLIKRK